MKSISPDPVIGVSIIVLLLFTIWMYKEVRIIFVENNKNDILKINKALEMYSELDFELSRYKRVGKVAENYIQLEEKITRIISVIPLGIFMKINSWTDSGSGPKSDLLKEIHKDIRGEIERLKLLQSDVVTYKEPEGLTGLMGNYYKTKLAPFIIPLFFTIGNLVFLFFLIGLVAIILSNQNTLSFKILSISMVFSLIIYTLIIDLIVSLVIIKKRFIHSVLNWSLFAVFLIFPISFSLIPDVWYKWLIVIIISISYAYYAARYSTRRTNNVSS